MDHSKRAQDLLQVIVAMMGVPRPQPATELALIERLVAAFYEVENENLYGLRAKIDKLKSERDSQ